MAVETTLTHCLSAFTGLRSYHMELCFGAKYGKFLAAQKFAKFGNFELLAGSCHFWKN